jgi:hypothetical protein
MSSTPLFALIFVFSLVSVAVTAQTPAADSGALARLNFTNSQRETIYQSVVKTKKNNAAPVGFRGAIGALVPSGVELATVPGTITELIPQIKGLEVALVEGEVLLVDPRDRTVIAIVTPQPQPE